MNFKFILGVLLLSICTHVLAEEFDAKVIVVMDGDTVMVLRDGKKIKVRLANIDAPESDQAFGKESRQALADRVLKKQVRIKSQAVDSYGRMIAEISLDGSSVNEEQVSKGMAWANSRFHRNKRYLELDKQARQSNRGLWAKGTQAISPEQWRKSHPAKISTAKVNSRPPVNKVCGKKHLCSQMKSCEEAKVYFMQCAARSLDGNGDGVPCESLCVTEAVKLPSP